MSTTAEPVPAAARRTTQSVVDCDIHNYMPSEAVLLSYLDPAWHAHHRAFGPRTHQVAAFPGAPYPRSAGGGKRIDAKPPSGLPVGADFDFFRAQHLDALPIEVGIINCLSKVGENLHEEYDAALARAHNDWLAKEWLGRDDRLRGSLLVPYENGELSAREIERWAGHPGFVQVMLRPRTKDALGRRKYWPMYAAAERHGLVIAVHFAGVSGNPISSSGWSSFYIEDHTTMAQSFQAHVISLVAEGVFERFPRLRMVLIEGGFAWLPPLMWRLDRLFHRLKAEVPHLRRKPSEVIREHIRLTTQPMEEPPRPRQLLQVIEHLGSEEMLMFATDYPHWDFDHPDRVLSVGVPPELRRKIMAGNARALYGLASREG